VTSTRDRAAVDLNAAAFMAMEQWPRIRARTRDVRDEPRLNRHERRKQEKLARKGRRG
jgi:hypothetical protein